MEQIIIVAVVMTLSVLITAQVMGAAMRWSRGRGLLRRPEIVEVENQERLWKAKADRARGWRELFRAAGQYVIVVVLIGMLGVILGGTLGR